MANRFEYSIPPILILANVLRKQILRQAEAVHGADPIDRTTRRNPTKQLDQLIQRTESLMDLDLPSGREAQEDRLFVVLAAALAIYYRCGSGKEARETLGHNLLASHNIKRARRNSSEVVPFAKLVLPGRKSGDYYRYGQAIEAASRKKMTPKEFYEHLKRPGGMAGFTNKNAQ